MADIRIKDLTTLAPSAVSDDYLAIDGTTNGTRKLSAYSPSFGGNATVGGTLTVSGATMSVGGGSGSIVSALDGTAGNYKLHLFRSGGVDRWYCGLQAATETGSNAGAPFGITALSDAGAQIDVPLQITRAAGGAVTIVRPTAITNTTASTTTSTGALVVGNGTSGGLGVGGAIFAGGNIQCNAVFAANNTTLYLRPSGASVSSGQTTIETSGIMAVSGMVKGAAATYSGSPPTGVASAFQVDVENATTRDVLSFGDSSRAGLLRGTHDGSGRVTWAFGRYTASTFAEYVRITGVAATDAVLSIYGTTASTSTSSGALVVSGGVGVAGAIVTGGIVRCGGSNGLSLGSDTGNIRIDTAGSAGVEFRGLSSADTITGFTMREMALIDGTTAPSTRAGYATIYVDTADGDLKVKFGDGTVKTIATDS